MSYFRLGRIGIEGIFQDRVNSVEITSNKWTHLAWTFEDDMDQSHFYIDGTRQPWLDFGTMSLDFESK